MIKLKLNELLNEKNMTILQLSDIVGISRSTLNSMVNGTTKGIQFSTIETLCNFFRCDINDLIEFTPTVEIPNLHSIHVSNTDKDEYFILFTYSFATRSGIEYTGVRLKIVILNNNQIKMNIHTASNKEIFESVYKEKIYGSAPRIKRENLLIKKEIDKKLVPEDGEERVYSIFTHYNLALDNWEEFKIAIESIEGPIIFSYSAYVEITNFFEVPYRTIEQFNPIKISNDNIVENIINNKEMLIANKVESFLFTFSVTKDGNRKNSRLSKEDVIDVKFSPKSSSTNFSEIEYKELKSFN